MASDDEKRKPDNDLTVTIGGKQVSISDLVFQTRTETRSRADSALPGTCDLPPLIALVPPPIDLELVDPIDGDSNRDYGPDPVADYSLSYPADEVMDLVRMSSVLGRDAYDQFANPTLYVRTPAGRTTFMHSSEAPTEATEIIAAWTLGEAAQRVEAIQSGAEKFGQWLSSLPYGLTLPDINVDDLKSRAKRAQEIIEVLPETVSVTAWKKDGAFPGKLVWDTLHRVGLQWGDMDQFQWPDPTHQTDYLFWAEVDDDRIGYALPEEIAAGRQHFTSIRFIFDIARTPHPAHVLHEMLRAVHAAQDQLGSDLVAMVDNEEVSDPKRLEEAIASVARQLAACGVKPGSSSVCLLR